VEIFKHVFLKDATQASEECSDKGQSSWRCPIYIKEQTLTGNCLAGNIKSHLYIYIFLNHVFIIFFVISKIL